MTHCLRGEAPDKNQQDTCDVQWAVGQKQKQKAKERGEMLDSHADNQGAC